MATGNRWPEMAKSLDTPWAQRRSVIQNWKSAHENESLEFEVLVLQGDFAGDLDVRNIAKSKQDRRRKKLAISQARLQV